MSWKLPGVKVEPVVWNFDLVSVDDFLLENSISVSEAVTPGGEVEGGQAVKETSCETTKATVTQSSVMLLFDDVFDSESEFVKTSCISSLAY